MDLESCSSSSSSSSPTSPSSFVMHQISPFNPNPSKLISLTPSPVPKRKAGRKKFKETRHPTYRGIRLRNGNKWVCEVREPKKKSRLWLGTFPCPKMAARAHDVAALALRGNSASLNFPESVSLLPRAKSSSPEDIQAAALEAAQGTISEVIGCSDQNSNQLDNRCQTFVEMEVDEVQIYDGSVMAYDDDRFFDEEAVFNMPSLLQSMAEGMLIAPPALVRGMFDSEHEINNLEEDLYLWSH